MFWFAKCRSKNRLDGKTAVITGCNTGIGKETALDFVKRGCRVIMACRNTSKAEEAAEHIRKKTENCTQKGEVVVVELDLSSLKSVRECAQYLLKTEQQINLLINNAGVMFCPKGKTEDGFETHFGVNHLGHFLFTCLLLPRIINSAPARIVNVASLMYLFGAIPFDDINSDKSYNPRLAYAQSKLANILFTKELAERLQGTGVTTYSLHPGIVRTELGRHLDTCCFKGLECLFVHASHFFTMSPKQGAQTTIKCAVDEKLAEESGHFYRNCKKRTPLAKARDVDVARRLWEESVKMVGLENSDPFTEKDDTFGKEKTDIVH